MKGSICYVRGCDRKVQSEGIRWKGCISLTRSRERAVQLPRSAADAISAALAHFGSEHFPRPLRHSRELSLLAINSAVSLN